VFGTAREREETRPPSDASGLADLIAEDWLGRDVRLGDLWADGPALLLFVRHWGCTFCRDQAVRLDRDRDAFTAAGVRPVVIGQGTPEAAARFRADHDIGVELLVDPGRGAFRAAGTKVGTMGELMGPRQMARALARSLRSGVHQGRTVGHPAQLGGSLLVLADGSLPWCHLSDDASDYPGPREALAAVESALPAASRAVD
jgi:peroxiredoxin